MASDGSDPPLIGVPAALAVLVATPVLFAVWVVWGVSVVALFVACFIGDPFAAVVATVELGILAGTWAAFRRRRTVLMIAVLTLQAAVGVLAAGAYVLVRGGGGV